MRKTLTQEYAQSVKRKKSKTTGKYTAWEVRDIVHPGLTLRIQPTGRKFWKIYQNRKPRTLGEFPAMTFSMAKEKWRYVTSGEERRDIEAAEAARIDKERQEAEEANIFTVDRFIEEHYEDYLEAHHSRPAESLATIRRFKFGKKHLDKIKIADVEKWRRGRVKLGRSPKTINRDVATLKAALQKAVDWELIPEHPLARLKPLKVDKRGVVRYLDEAETARMMQALEQANPWLRALVTVALNTGLRRGELWNLTWADIGFKQNMLVVHGKGAKSKQTRHVPLNITALDALKRWRGDIVPMKTLPVFGQHEFKKSWATLLKNAGIENFRFHDTRHTFASKLVSAGVPLNDVRELLGHSDLSMTMIYAHLSPANLKNAVELIG